MVLVYLLAKVPILRVITSAILFQFLPLQTILSQYTFLENGTPLQRGSDVGFLADTPTRKKIDLSGIWTYKILEGPEGTVRVPGAYDFTAEVTFQRSFEITPDDLDKYQFQLVMLGANYNTTVAINNDFITNHIGGYTSFVAPIPSSVLQAGTQNVIKIVTDNKLDPSRTIPLRSQVWGWRNYGGILRDAYILAMPRVFISSVIATPTVSSDFTVAKIAVSASIDGSFSTRDDSTISRLQWYAEIVDKQTNLSVASSNTLPVTFQNKTWTSGSVELTVNGPRLWSPETPDLYIIKVYLVNPSGGEKVDEYDVNAGTRKIEFVNGSVVVNGKKTLLKGLLWMEDHKSFGSSLPYEEMEKDVVMMKSIGANAIRFGHHPPHPYMLSLCDRYGLLALEELPVKNVPGSILSQEYYIELAGAMMREMIARDRNHPSVFAWGIGDDFDTWSTASRTYVEQLVKLARSLDSRPVYYATNSTSDLCSDLVDIAAVSLTTRDIKEFKRELDDLRIANAGKPLFVVRMGAEVQPDNTNGYSDPLSTQAQARYVLQHVDIVRSSNADGVFLWSFNDWKGDRPALTVNSGDPWMHSMGVVTRGREKRIAFDAVRSAFNNDKFSALPIGSNPSSAPILYVVTGLVILIGTAYLYNANRRFREGLNRSMVNAYNFFSDVRDQRIVTVFHSTLLGLIVSAATAIVVSSILYRFRSSIALDNFLSYILVSDNLKEDVVKLILNPKLFLPVFTGIFFLLLLVISMVLWLVAPIFKVRIYPFHAFAITMWSTPPLLLLVPLGMILYRLMDSPVYILPAIILCVVLLIWVVFRFLKGISIILDTTPLKVYVIGILSLIGMFAAVYFYLDYSQSASLHVTLLYNDILTRTH